MLLHSKILGEGQPLLIIHGLFGSSDNWGTLGKKFAEHFQVHLIDLRNHGRSFHSEEMNYGLMVADLLEYTKYHQLENTILLGHSMGGKTAMKLALEHPETLEKVLIADIAPKHYPPHHQSIIKAMLSVDFSTVSSRKEVDATLSKYITDLGVKQFILKNVYWTEDKKLAFRMNVPVLSNHYEDLMESDLSGQFDKPTLFLKGEKSFYIQPEDEESIKNLFPKAKIITISNAGHWLHAENPNDFYSEVMKFLM
ncbi:esterase [Flavobacteriaceae bacterium UJ101]|nr:esterase [Flavobacteriaceae bacterium UJ101]